MDNYGRTAYCLKLSPNGNECKMLKWFWQPREQVPAPFLAQYDATGGKICPGGLVGGGFNFQGTPEFDLCYGKAPHLNDPPPPPSPPPTTLHDLGCRIDDKGKWRNSKCAKKKRKGKCCQKKAQRKCRDTCCGGKTQGFEGSKCPAS